MGIACRIRLETNRAVLEQLEAWQKGHQAAMPARDLEDFVQWLLALRSHDKILFDRMARDVSAGAVKDFARSYRIVQTLCDDASGLLQKIKAIIRAAEREGLHIDSADQINQAIKDYAKWKDDFYDFLLLSEPRVQKPLKKRMDAARIGRIRSRLPNKVSGAK